MSTFAMNTLLVLLSEIFLPTKWISHHDDNNENLEIITNEMRTKTNMPLNDDSNDQNMHG